MRHWAKLVSSSSSRRNRDRELLREHKGETLEQEALKPVVERLLDPKAHSISMRLGCVVEGPIFLSLHGPLQQTSPTSWVLLLTTGEPGSTKWEMIWNSWLSFHFYTNRQVTALASKFFWLSHFLLVFFLFMILVLKITQRLGNYNVFSQYGEKKAVFEGFQPSLSLSGYSLPYLLRGSISRA